MATFHYEAWNAEQQPITGDVEAASVVDAIAALEVRGLVLRSISVTPLESAVGAAKRAPFDTIGPREIIEQKILRTHLAKVLEGGKAIVPALQAFSEEMPTGRRRSELHTLIRILERGDAAEAEKAFAELPEYWIPLLSAAISSTDPGRILQEFIRESQRADELRRQRWLMLSYPLLITIAAAAVLILLSVLVIPIFREIFKGFGLELPWITKVNLAVAHWIEGAWPYLLVILAIVLVGVGSYLIFGARRSTRVSNRFIGLFGRTTAIARLCQFMADLLEAGLTVPDTLEVSGFLTNRRELRSAVWGLADEIKGIYGSTAQLEAPRKMASVYHALRAETPTPSRVRLLRELSQANAEKVRLRLSWTRGLIEPGAIIVIGSVVALVVFSLFIPLVKLIEGLAH